MLSINRAQKLSISYLIFHFTAGQASDTKILGSSLYLKADGFGSIGPTGLVSVSENQKMFHVAAETPLFQCSGHEFLFSTFIRTCFDFLGQLIGGPPAVPNATAP